ncbi:hypothetical protein JCM6882_007360 [Rhodosporidiobolus microsporus]
MHLVRPSWVAHIDDERPTKPSLTIYSLDIHPDGSRLATGGLDSIIRIWATAPILNEEAEKNEKVPKLLSTLAAHAGVVMSVRWNHSGSHLASGSDDKVVMIWAHDGSGGGKVWGSETTNIENWKATHRLVGHQSDVAGVDWSPNDDYVASVGLDNVVLIWSGQNFQLLQKLSHHTGFVKGLVFDPAGQFLATQADDNTLKVWRTADWGLHAEVRDVFVDAPKAGVVRPAWSPDGAYIVAPNAMNGPVFCAAVIDRKSWKSPNSLIGHPDIVQVAAYNPLIFLRDPSLPPQLNNTCSLLALCAQGSVSLWFTDQSSPFLVLEDVMDREVLDMRWSKDGLSLWISSSEGHVSALTFSLSEYAPVAPPSTQADLFATQYGVAPRAKLLLRPVSAAGSAASLGGAGGGAGQGTLSQPNTLVARKGPNAKRPRLIQPVAQPLVGGVVQPVPLLQQQQQQQALSAMAAPFQPAQPSPLQNAMAVAPVLPPQQQQGANPFAAAQPMNAFASTSAGAAGAAAFGAPPPPGVAAADPAAAAASNGRKRKSTAQQGPGAGEGYPYPYPHPHAYPYPPYPYPYPGYDGAQQQQPPPPGYVGGGGRASDAPWRLQGHTLAAGGAKAGEKKDGEREARELAPAYCVGAVEREVTFRVSNLSSSAAGGKGKGKEAPAPGLAVPPVMSHGKVKLEDADGGDTFEWRCFGEGERKGESELTVVNTSKKEKSLWVDYVPRYVVCATGSPAFTAVSLEDGSLVAWSPTGRRLIPTLILDAPCSFLEAEGTYLLALTALGTLTVFNLSPSLPKPRSIYPPLNITSLLVSSTTRAHPTPTITTSALLPNGTPLLALSTGATFSYDRDLQSWTRVSEPWWARKSEAWEGRRGRGGQGLVGAGKGDGRGIVRKVESAVNEIVVNEGIEGVEEEETTDEEDEDEEKDGGEKEESGGDVEMNGAADQDKGKGKAVAAEGETPPSSSLSTPRPPKRVTPQGPAADPKGSSSDYRTSISLAHLETRLQAAVQLDSPAEYKVFLVQYAKRLADEGLRSKAEEVVRELLGPIYHKPGKEDDDKWSPTVLGLQKRELLRDVLRELAKSRTTQPLANEYQDTLRKITAPW